jgi:hypothetical protein
MCPIGNSPDRADVVESNALQTSLSVSGTAVEIRVGGTRLVGRQFVAIYNDSNVVVFTGPSASVSASGANKGLPLYRDQERVIPIGDRAVYAITAGGSATLLVQEYA